MDKIFWFAGVLILIYIGIFFIPVSVVKFALDPAKITEVWRFFTYSLAHLNIQHLIENIIGIGIISFIAFELKVALTDFSSVYLSSGVLSALPVWFLIPFITLGASNAIFGGFGLLIQELKKFKMRQDIIILAMIVLIFFKTTLLFFMGGLASREFVLAFRQSVAHFSGLIFGVGFFYFLQWVRPIITKKKRYTLRGDYL